MSDSADTPRGQRDGSPDPFGGEDVLPFEKQRRAHRFITQETRYHIIQAILGHSAHLVTLDELEYLVPKNRSTIRDHLDRLAEKNIVVKQSYEGDDGGQAIPRDFWRFTTYGITLLDEYNYLRYVPVLRALQDNLYLTEKIERHRNAPRPALPEDVANAFTAPTFDAEMQAEVEDMVAVHERGDSSLFDAPATPDTDGDAARPLDELF
jgi:predicted ArsR family transcriptional regulator